MQPRYAFVCKWAYTCVEAIPVAPLAARAFDRQPSKGTVVAVIHRTYVRTQI